MNNINLFTNTSTFNRQEPEERASDEKITALAIQAIENGTQLSTLSDREVLVPMEQFSSGWEDSLINSTTLEETVDVFFENAPRFPADDLEPSLSLPSYSTSTETTSTEDSIPIRDQNMASQIKEAAVQISAVSIPTLHPKQTTKPPTKQGKWYPQETASLMQMYYENLPPKDIAIRLNRTEVSCSRKINHLLQGGHLNKESINNLEKPEMINVISRSVEELNSRTNTPWTQGETNKLLELHNMGFTISEIAENLSRTLSSIQHKLNNLEQERIIPERLGKKSFTAWTKEERDTLIKLYNQGLTDKKIGESLGRSAGSVHAKIMSLKQEKQIPNRSGKKTIVTWKNEETKTLIELYNQGLTDKKIGESLGRSVNSVYTKIKSLQTKGIIFQREKQ